MQSLYNMYQHSNLQNSFLLVDSDELSVQIILYRKPF